MEPPHHRELKPTTERTQQFAHPDGLIVRVEELSSTVLLMMEGDIDLATVHHAMAAADGVDLDRITLLVIDLDRVGFVDLAGLHAILRINDDCEEHDVHLTVITPRSAASRVFTLTRAHLKLDLVDAGVGPGR